MSKLAAVIFDKDGTLFDFQATWGAWAGRVLAELARRYGVRAEDLGARIGFAEGRYAEDSPVIAGTLGQIVALLLPALPGAVAADVAAYLDAEAKVAPLAPVVPLAGYLAGLRAQGLKLACMTNDSEASARAHLTAEGVLGLFDVVLGFDSGFGEKPSPAPLLAAARLLGVAPEAVVMVGDSRHDLSAGRAAGMATVGVLTGPARAKDLADLADVVLGSIDDLPVWMAGRAG